jgi:hypothetical protein
MSEHLRVKEGLDDMAATGIRETPWKRLKAGAAPVSMRRALGTGFGEHERVR